MQLIIQPEKSFDCPAGIYSGTFYEHKEVSKRTSKGTDKFIRLVFAPDIESPTGQIILVGRNFLPLLKRGTDLRDLLDGWLGDKFVEQHAENGKFDLDLLEGIRADLVVRHIENEGYPRPYVLLESVLPPGTKTGPRFIDAKEGI